MSLALAIFFVLYFLAIMEFEVHGGQITKIYYDLRYLMHEVLERYTNLFFACE